MKKKETNMVKDTRNDDRMLGARYGRYQGKDYLFTHRNPKNGDLYGEDIPVDMSRNIYGKWVHSDSVVFC